MVHRSRVALTVARPVAWLLVLLGALLLFAGIGMAGKTLLTPRGPPLDIALRNGLVGGVLAAVGLVLWQLTRPPTWQLRGWEHRKR